MSGPVVVRTRLRPPRAHPEEIVREGLLRRLDGVTEPITLVAAPRGAGKTVLLAQWVRRLSSAWAWISLGPYGDTPAALWSAVCEAIRPTHGPLAIAVGDDLGTVLGVTVPQLLNVLAEGEPLTIVFDGLDAVEHPVSRAGLYEFVRGLPDGVRVVLSTARPAAGPVPALRAAGRVAEFGETDLCLDLDETRELVERVAGEPATAAELHRVYGGWAAGVRLAAANLRTSTTSTPSEVAPTVREYMRAEVLERVPERWRRFLVTSCVLDELTADRCAAVTGFADAGTVLGELSDASLLIRRLPGGERFRCHPVLRTVLQSVLRSEYAGAVRDLHERAAECLEREGDVAGALRHARAGGSRGLAARIAVDGWPRTPPDVLLATLDPDAATDGRVASVAAAAELALGRRAAAAERLAGLPRDAAEAAVHGLLAWAAGDREAARRHSRGVAAAGGCRPDASPWWDALASVVLGSTLVWDGRIVEATVWLERGIEGARACDYRDAAVLGLDAVTVAREFSGDRAGAAHAAADAVALERQDPGSCRPPAAAYAHLASTDPTPRRVAAAESASDRAHPFSRAAAALVLAWLADDPRPNRARAAAAIAGRRPGPVLDALRAAGNPSALPLSRRERTVLKALAGPLTLREIAAELHLSHNTVKSHARAVYRKLGVHSRIEAVAARGR